jgi:hypothetical protein
MVSQITDFVALPVTSSVITPAIGVGINVSDVH